MASDASVRIRLLGPPEVHVDGRPWRIDTRKATAIIALLATERRPFAREELAAILWPESDDEAARGALRRTLSTMRTAIGREVVRIDRNQVALDPDRVEVDLDLVDAAAAGLAGRSDPPDRASLEAAASAARGAFLAGFTLRDSPEWDDWRAARAVGVERAVVAVLDALADRAVAEGDRLAAIEAVTRRLAIDPLDEAAHVRLMDLHAAAGDRGAALRQYRTCVAVLDRELGVGPLPETTARYEAIRDGRWAGEEPAASGDGTATSPAGTTAAAAHAARPPLVGRDAELQALGRAYGSVDTTGRIAVVTGEPGIGKTRLLDALADLAQAGGGRVIRLTGALAEHSIPYGALVGTLRAVGEGSDGAALLARLPTAVRVELGRLVPAVAPPGSDPVADGPGAQARLVAAIGDGLTAAVAGPVPGLVLVDDTQWLDAATAEALAAVAHRLERYPVLLAFAWRPSDLEGPVGRLAVGVETDARTTPIVLHRLPASSIAELVRAIDDAAPDRPGVGAQRLDRVVAAAEGLPLYAVEAIAAGAGEADALPSGVRAMIRERLLALPATSAQVLGAVAVAGRAVDPATLRHASGRGEDEVVEAIDALSRRGLVVDAAEGVDVTHGAIREVVIDGLGPTRLRLLHRRIAEAYRLDLPGFGRDDLRRLVLIADHERAAGRDAEAALAAAAAGARAAAVFANEQAIEQLEAALALGHPDRVGLLVEVGRLRTRIGSYDAAIAALEGAAALAGPEALPGIEWSLGRAHLRRGDLAAARHHLDAAAGSPDPRVAAGARVDRSAVERREHRPEDAAATAERALALADDAGDGVTAGAARRARGLARLDLGDAQGARADLATALAAAIDDPDPTAAIAARVGLARAHAAAGDADGARREGAAAVAGCQRIGDRHLEAAVENHLADLLHDAGLEDESREHSRRAAVAFAEFGGDPSRPDPGIWMLAVS
jgi:DNA-binding SARP family transcriptional activator/tetratricopeptide (TPR) repeat protein